MLTGPLIGRGKKSNLVGFLETSLRKKWLILQENFAKKQSLKNNNFVPIFVFFFPWGGGGGECWAVACAITTTTTETSTTYKLKCCLFRTGDFGFKAPICFNILFGLGYCLAQGFFYQRSSFALLTTMSSEMHQWQSFLYHALASAQFFVLIVWEHLVVLGRFLVAMRSFKIQYSSEISDQRTRKRHTHFLR